MLKIGLSKKLQINIGCLKICQSNFISTNREGKITERCINIPPLNTPLSHVVTKRKGVWLPQGHKLSMLFNAIFLRRGLPWISWRWRNDMVFNIVQWRIEKTCQVVWDALQDYSRIEWKRILSNLEKVPDVAYQDVLNKFDSTWGSKVSLWPGVTKWSPGRLYLIWALFLDFPLGCTGSLWWLYFGSFL